MYDLERWQTLQWRKGSRTYLAEVRQDLFGAWELVRHWGSAYTRQRRTLTQPAASYGEALALLQATAQRRAQRGYTKAG